MGKVIDVPPSIGVTPKSGEKTENTFVEFCQVALDGYAPLGRGWANVERAIRLTGKVNLVKAGAKTIRLDDEDYNALKAAVESYSYPPPAARLCEPFYKALMNPQTVDFTTSPTK